MEETGVLDELVVTGYGTQTKRDVTGSVSKVSGDVISKLPVTSVDQALQGQAPGVMVVSNSGTPGGAVSVRVRGPSSIASSSQPLYVIDGIPMTTGSFAQLGTGNQQTNALSDLNPADIESIEILKDAAAAAIYGARSANGVVLVTTKRGKAGKPRITLGTYYGQQSQIKPIEQLTGPEFVSLNNEMRRAAGLAIRYPDTINVPTTDWNKEIFRVAPMSQTDLSFDGGTEKLRYRLSATYFDQEGIILGSSFNRISLRANIDNQLNDKLKLTFSSAYSRTMSTRINNDNNIFGVLSTAVLHGPHTPVKDANGVYVRDPFNSIENPVAAALEPTFENPTTRFLTNVGLAWNPIKSLTIRSNVGADLYNFREFRFYPTTSQVGSGVNGQGFETYAAQQNLINENLVNYVADFGDNFNLDIMGGISFQNSKNETIFTQDENFPGNAIKVLQAAAVKKDAQSDRTLWGINSQFGRVNLKMFDKIILTGVVRRDGSSRFGANKKYGIFPSASAAYILSEEKFLKNNKTISLAKVRLGWGRRGNSDIANFASRGLIRGGATYNQIAGLAQTQLGDPELGWETREDLTYAVDLNFFNDRLQITAEGYQGTTKDMLLPRPLPATSGFLTITQNVGEMKNNGWDFGITTVNVKKKGFEWRTTLNISTYTNTVTKLLNEFPAGFASYVDTGYALGSFRGYQTVKIFQTQSEIDDLNRIAKEKSGVASAVYQSTATRPGDIMFKDLDGNGIITAADQEILGNANPKFYGGITNSFSYNNKNFGGIDASFFFQFQQGGFIYNNTNSFAEGMNGQFGQFSTVRQRWTPTNPQTNIRFPRAIWGDPNNNRRVSNRFLEDASYMRLKNINIGYTLPAELVKKLHLGGFRIYYTGLNLVTFTKYSGLDPEVNTFAEGGVNTTVNAAFGTDFLTFPQARAHNFGIQVSF